MSTHHSAKYDSHKTCKPSQTTANHHVICSREVRPLIRTVSEVTPVNVLMIDVSYNEDKAPH
jgi:hypothetical protein